MGCCQCLRGGRLRDGRQACCYSEGSKAGVRERESGGLTRVELNKLEEMMLTIVTAATVCLFVTFANEVMLSVCLIKISQALLDRFQ